MKELCQMQAWGSGAATPPHPHHTCSSRSFHGAPSNKCKKKEPQTFPIKFAAFTIGAIQRKTSAKQAYNAPDHQYEPLENKGKRRKKTK
jgi:hypothetical protein